MNRSNQPASTPLMGILVLDKPYGISSMQAVARVRHRAGRVKTGHAGTLDPLATGVLVLALGRATKHADAFMRTDKRYRTVIDLSAFTKTDDLESEPEPVTITTQPTHADITAALQRFIGEIQQTPSAFSAINVDGKRAYTLARKGEKFTMKPRAVVIHSITMTDYVWPNLTIDVCCGKGVYIRSLARDIGEVLGTGGHCTALRRTAVGPFDESMAIALDDVPERLQQDRLIYLEDALAMLNQSPD